MKIPRKLRGKFELPGDIQLNGNSICKVQFPAFNNVLWLFKAWIILWRNGIPAFMIVYCRDKVYNIRKIVGNLKQFHTSDHNT